jgi:hypothetical protein
VTLPNFIVIGAAKSGTEALCTFLGEHPDVYMCPHREPNFFEAEGRPEVPYRGPGDAAWLGPEMWTATLEEYEALFAGADHQRAVGEGTASYLYSDSGEVPARIQRHLPEARLVAVLRNPVDRAYSAYSMMRGIGREPLGRFADALDAEEQRRAEGWEPIWHYVRMGLYTEQLRRYDERFAADQLKVLLYDDFEERPARVLAELFAYLGVDEAFVPDTTARHNVSLVPRSSRLHRLTVGRFAPRRAAKAVVPARVRRRLQRRIQAQNLVRPDPLEPALRARLLETFRPDVLALQDRLGRDLSGWLA